MSTGNTLACAVRCALISNAGETFNLAQLGRRNANRLAYALAATLIATSPVARAQSTSGSLFGQAAAGETVVIDNTATGFHREVPVDADGSYRVPALQPGSYKVTLRRANGTTAVRNSVAVNAGAGTPVNFAGSMETVTVTGSRVNQIDVSSVESVTILSAEQLEKIPVLRDLTSAALLAPGAVRGDTAFASGKLASFGGSSVAENQYYVNGFNVTNSFRSLNFSKIPFEAIAEQQVKTGGYGAEFGRSLGGVVSQTTKRGKNQFETGASVYWAPASLRATSRDAKYSNPLDPASLGGVRFINSEEETGEWSANYWAGGALIKDKLFAYGVIGYTQHEEDRWGNVTQRTNTNDTIESPTWLLKLDWNINASNLFEVTAFSDKDETIRKVYLNSLNQADRLDLVGTSYTENGGNNYVAKYTSYITNDLTLSALYGHGEYSRGVHLKTANGIRVAYGGNIHVPASGCPVVTDGRTTARRAATGVYASTCNITGGAVQRENAGDTRDQYRIDADWQLGAHLVRFGYDIDNYESVAGQSTEGGRAFAYSTTPAGQDIVRETITTQGATVEVKQRAFYVEDNWSITERFLLSTGLRWDSFENLNGQGQTYVEVKNQFGPRLGFSWDAKGDSSLKVYGNAGRYALPLTPSVAIRGASASLLSRQDYNFTGVDPVTGAPTGLTPRGPIFYVNGESGAPKNSQAIASKNLEPMYQDEFILGVQMTLTSHQRVGARAIYRNLKAAIDDNCDHAPIEAAGQAAGLDPRRYVLPAGGFPYCRIFNPGEDAVFATDFYSNGVLTTTTIDGALLSPQARRTYKALELSWDGSWNRTFLQASYTLAFSKGNTEGGVKSDIGQGDTNTTSDFDYKELAVDSYGYLPNDRRHALKIFGSYSFTDEFSAGMNLGLQSGRPKNCLGVLSPWPASQTNIHSYGSQFFRCGTTAAGGTGPAEAKPRGTAGRLPWTYSVDLSLAYTPHWLEGLTARLDVFNVLNQQKVLAVTENAESGATGVPASTYLTPRAFQESRFVQFNLRYDF